MPRWRKPRLPELIAEARSPPQCATPGRCCEPPANRADESKRGAPRVAEGLEFGVVWFLVAVLVVIVLAAAGIAVRRILLGRGGGTVECGLRRGPDQGWHLGLAAYRPDELLWYRALGSRLRPD
jgi:hypothetical protein